MNDEQISRLLDVMNDIAGFMAGNIKATRELTEKIDTISLQVEAIDLQMNPPGSGSWRPPVNADAV